MGTVAPGVITEQFPVRARPGESPEATSHRGLPAGVALREYAGVESFGYLTIPRPTGTVAYIPGSAFVEPTSPEFEGGLLALFSYNEGSTRFVRPAFAGDSGDVNAEDSIATVTGESLVVGVHEGAIVKVGASASTTSTDAGSAVGFTATASGGEPGERFSFEWRFGDGATATGESVSHTFTGSGVYEVRVVAVGTDESGGESGPLSVVVGNPPTAVQSGATPTPVPEPIEAKPKQSSGRGHGSNGAHAGGSATGSHGARGQQRTGDRGAKRRSHGGSTEAGATLPSTTTAAAPAPETPTVPAAPSSPAAPSAQSPATSGPPAGSAAATSQDPANGEVVEGRLVADDLGPVSVAEAGAGPSSEEGSRSVGGKVGDGGLGVPVVALIVVALPAAGALFEWRRRPAVPR
jgi:PKD repeat protein